MPQQYDAPPALTIDPEKSYTATFKTEKGDIVIELFADKVPNTVNNFVFLARDGFYDDTTFHRVIDGFMAQTGDVEHGCHGDGLDLRKAGTGGSNLPDLQAEFSRIPHDRGTLGAARSQNPNSANSQFFINFSDNHFLDGQYTVYGRVIEGMEFVDAISRGEPPAKPDQMISVKVAADG